WATPSTTSATASPSPPSTGTAWPGFASRRSPRPTGSTPSP
ncbi:MAG: hypothetical protein AVDCRST_MAG54-4672, partial [uncultured Actinomycetospora sp.]